MADILEEARQLGGPLVVKINTEGEECRIVLGTPPEAWAGVSELFVEMHEWAGCNDAELEVHLAPVGFRRVPTPLGRVLRLRREEAPRSGRHTAPT